MLRFLLGHAPQSRNSFSQSTKGCIRELRHLVQRFPENFSTLRDAPGGCLGILPELDLTNRWVILLSGSFPQFLRLFLILRVY